MRRALVIGLGRMGSLHRKVLRDLGFRVESVDPFYPEATFRSLEEAGTDYEVAVVATPIADLTDQAWKINLLGVPVLVEKPLAASVSDARDFARYARGKVGVGYIERFNPKVLELRDWLQGKEVQTASFVRHNDRPSVDRRIDLLTHDVDLAAYLDIPLERCSFDVEDSNSERVRLITVNGKAWNLMAHDTSPLHGLWHGFLTESEDVATPWDAVRTLERAHSLEAELHMPFVGVA